LESYNFNLFENVCLKKDTKIIDFTVTKQFSREHRFKDKENCYCFLSGVLKRRKSKTRWKKMKHLKGKKHPR